MVINKGTIVVIIQMCHVSASLFTFSVTKVIWILLSSKYFDNHLMFEGVISTIASISVYTACTENDNIGYSSQLAYNVIWLEYGEIMGHSYG